MAKASLGAAAARSGLTPMMEYRAKKPEPAVAGSMAGGGGGGRRKYRRRGTGRGGGGSRTSNTNNQQQYTSADQVPLDEKTVEKVKKAQDLMADMELRKQQVLSDENLPETQARTEVAKADREIFKTIWNTFLDTKDKDGTSGIAGDLWGDWIGKDGEDLVMQQYEDDSGNKRVRVLHKKDKIVKRDGKMVSEPEYVTADFRGAKADFSYDELRKRFQEIDTDADTDYFTAEDRTVMHVRGNKATPVQVAAKDGMKPLKEYKKEETVTKPPSEAAAEIYRAEMDARLPDTGRRIDPEEFRKVEKEALNATIKQMKGFYDMPEKEIKKMVQAFQDGEGGGGGEYRTPEDVREAYQSGKLKEDEAIQLLKGFTKQ